MEEIINMIMGWAIILVLVATFFGIPLIIMIFFIMNLYQLIKKNKENKINPGSYSDDLMKKEKIEIFIWGILSAGAVIFIINLINMLNRPITFM